MYNVHCTKIVHDWILLSTVNVLIIQVHGFSLQIIWPGAICFTGNVCNYQRCTTVQTGLAVDGLVYGV